MGRGISLASAFQPAFGIPYPRNWERDFEQLTDDELIQLAGFKAQIAAGLVVDVKSLPPRLHLQATKLIVDKNALEDPMEYGWTLEKWNEVLADWKNRKSFFIFGGNRCLRGDSLIYDPVLGQNRRIDQIDGDFHVLAWNGYRLVAAEAQKPFTKPEGAMRTIRLSSGDEFCAALEHRVLDASGKWRELSELRVGDALYRPPSTAGIDQPNPFSSAPHSTETASGFPAGCHSEPRLYDGRPHLEVETGPNIFPLLGGAPKRISVYENICRWIWRRVFRSRPHMSDGRDRTLLRNGFLSGALLPTSWDDLFLRVGLFFGIQSRAFCKPCRRVLPSHAGLLIPEGDWQYSPALAPLRSTGGFAPPDKQFDDCVSYVESIEPAGIEVKWDMTVPAHGNYWHAGVIHHNSSKSVFASRLVVWCLMNIPECRVRCYQVNDEKSISEQQAYIWEALPARYKNLGRRRGQTHAIEYSQKNGFTGGKLILPPLTRCDRGGECIFGTYQQYRNDPQVVESFWCHVIWADEEMELKMADRLDYRVKDADGRIINTFTTIKGWTPLVEDVIGKARTLKRRHASLLKRDLPVTQESTKRAKTRIDYFWTEDNPFLPPNTMDSFAGRPDDEIKATAYGIPTKNAVAVLSLFDEEVHVIAHEKLPWVVWQKDADEKVKTGEPFSQQMPPHFTRYQVIDPAGDKSWFMIWAAVDALKRVYVYREWPDEGYGTWGMPGATPDGAPGPAQRTNDSSISSYVEIMHHSEVGEEIFERLIDPRLVATAAQTKDGAVTIGSELEDAGVTVIPAPGVNIQHGLDLIKNALQWDKTKPLSALNQPKLFISDRCQNLIEAMKNYSNYSTKEVWKDPVDCVRYLLEAGADHVPPEAMQNNNRTFSY